MSAVPLVERLAEVLGEHEAFGGYFCMCTPPDVDGVRDALPISWEAHLARALLPVVEQAQAQAWDLGRAAERRDWEFTFDLATPDEDRQPWPNPYRAESKGD